MNRREFKVSDFRKVVKRMYYYDEVPFWFRQKNDSSIVLSMMNQRSDEELLDFGLNSDLGMDSRTLVELVCVFECDYEILFDEGIIGALTSCPNLSVRSFIEIINDHVH